jgi:hypothetical protein
MQQNRTRHSVEFKAKMALAALSESKSNLWTGPPERYVLVAVKHSSLDKLTRNEAYANGFALLQWLPEADYNIPTKKYCLFHHSGFLTHRTISGLISSLPYLPTWFRKSKMRCCWLSAMAMTGEILRKIPGTWRNVAYFLVESKISAGGFSAQWHYGCGGGTLHLRGIWPGSPEAMAAGLPVV